MTEALRELHFYGPLTTADLTTSANATVGVEFGSTASLITSQIVIDSCVFNGTVWGINTSQQIQGITIANSEFNTLYNGVLLGTSTPVLGGPTGVRIVSNMFNNIYAEGIIFGDVSLNASGHNIFYDVGNHFTGSTGTPATAVISIQSANNISISDLFERGDAYATTFPRVDLNNVASIATTNGSELAMGTYVRESGSSVALVNDTTDDLFTVNANLVKAFSVDYTIVRDTDYRTGTLVVATATPITVTDDYTENADTGVTLNVAQVSSTVTISYTTTDTGVPGTIYYSITHLA